MDISPDTRVRLKLEQLAKIQKEAARKTYWNCVAETCKRDLWFFIRVALGWSWLDEDLHGKLLCGFYERNIRHDTAVFIPRGHGKTLLAAARIAQGLLNNPDAAIFFASATEPLANDFGQMVGKILIENEILLQAFPDILPKKHSEVDRWGKDGYSLPHRKPRIDPSLACFSLKGNVTGRHPDIAYLDDLIVRTNNAPIGWAQAELFIKEVKMLLPPQGVIHITGTRWHDADPYGKILRKKIIGKQGLFRTLLMSCYEGDNPYAAPIYPAKVRWNMSTITGYTKEQLSAMRAAEDQGGLGRFFDAQMRNDPAPDDRQDIKVSLINLYDMKDRPKLTEIRSVGVEVTGGGRLIYNLLLEKTEKLKFFLPLQEVTPKRTLGESKADKIKAVMEPIISSGRLFCLPWMVGDGSEIDTLGYEFRRLGVAAHDDIVDALHTVPYQLSCGTHPNSDEPAHLYMAVDLAYTEERQADFTVLMAVAVDSKDNYWVIDYDRFQLSSPTGVVDRIIEFYRKWSPEEEPTRRPLKRGFSFAHSYK